MARLEKLAISGIRSFSPEDPQQLEFQTPLTLIVGHNGAGKTTIIECLKYVTTGDLPPNSKQGAFLFDPKLANVTQIKAQVRLRFRNVNGTEMVCTRSVLAQQKAASITQKTLENALLAKHANGERYAISTKCAEMDVEISHNLGVSKAILENVVFCHQEDSLWPLGEAAQLKKKFDEIFAATKYTKALEAFKLIRKEQHQTMALDTQELRHLEEDQRRADQLDTIIHDLRERVRRGRERLDALDRGEVDALARQLDAKLAERQHIMDLKVALDQARLALQMKQQHRASVAAQIEQPLSGDADALQHAVDARRAQLAAQRAQLADQSQSAAALARGIAALKRRETALAKAAGADQAKRAANRRVRREFLALAASSRPAEATDDADAADAEAADEAAPADGSAAASDDASPETADAVVAIETMPVAAFRERLAGLVAQHTALAEETRAARASEQAALDALRHALADATQTQYTTTTALATAERALAQTETERDAVTAELAELAGHPPGSGGDGDGDDADDDDDAVASRRRPLADAVADAEQALAPYTADTMARLPSDLSAAHALVPEREAAVAEADAALQAVKGASAAQARLDVRRADLAQETAALAAKWAPTRAALPTSVVAAVVVPEASDALEAAHFAALLEVVAQRRQAAQAAVATARSEAEAAATAATRAAADQQSATAERDRATARLHAIDQQFADAGVDRAAYLAALAEVDTLADERQELVMSLESAGGIFKMFKAKFLADARCPLCLRGFGGGCAPDAHDDAKEADVATQPAGEATAPRPDAEAMVQFAQRLDRQLAKLPDNVAAARSSADEAVARRRDLRALRSAYDEHARLAAAAPALDARLADAAAAHASHTAAAARMRTALAAAEAADRELLAAQGPLDACAERAARVAATRADVAAMAAQLAETATQRRQVAAHEDALAAARAALQQARARLADLQQQSFQYHEKRTAAEARLAAARAALDTFDQQQARRLRLRTERRRLAATVGAHTETLAAARSAAAEAQQTQRRLEAEAAAAQTAHDAAERDRHSALTALGTHVTQLESLMRQIERFAAVGAQSDQRAEDLAEVQAALRAKEEALLSCRQGLEAVEHEQTKLSQLERDVANTLQIRALAAAIEQDEAALAEQEQHYRTFNMESIKQEYTALRDRNEALVGERHRLMGEMKEQEEGLRTQERLYQSQYADIDQRLKNQIVKLRTCQMAHQDLETYAKALESAIIQFHQLKMREINKIIGELWRTTYQGPDIDTIELRSSEGKGARSYDYRVVMVRDNIALDMRGRCSAGQKVLACIVIRLALAETFGTQCGVLALDEPTTNLDSDNVRGLAVALGHILEQRRHQQNFQLVIITHDEEFMQLLGKSEFTDWYYLIRKDDASHSRIERRPIGLI